MACSRAASRKKVNWSVDTGSRDVVYCNKKQARRWLPCSRLGDVCEVQCVLIIDGCTVNIMGSESSSDTIHGYCAPPRGNYAEGFVDAGGFENRMVR